LFELTSAFNIYNNYGIYIKPKLLIKIEDRYGKLLQKNDSLSYQAIDQNTSYIMLKLMQNVTNYGTAKSLRYYGVQGEVASKTGTSNNYSDGWFVGLVPNLTTVIWVGWEDRSVHFKDLYLGQGSKTALPIWAYYMMYLYSNTELKYTQYDKFQNLQNFDYVWNTCE
jgi:penicillin-binding protein 1A